MSPTICSTIINVNTDFEKQFEAQLHILDRRMEILEERTLRLLVSLELHVLSVIAKPQGRSAAPPYIYALALVGVNDKKSGGLTYDQDEIIRILKRDGDVCVGCVCPRLPVADANSIVTGLSKPGCQYRSLTLGMQAQSC